MVKRAHVVRVRDNLRGGHTDQTVDLTPEEVSLLKEAGWRLRAGSDWDMEMFVLPRHPVAGYPGGFLYSGRTA